MKHRPDLGLLVIRLGLGGMFVVHGFPKLMGGPVMWERLGKAMGNLGIDFFPIFWGFMAMFAELFGGLLLAAGLFWEGACALLTFTMLVAALSHFARGDGLAGASHAIEAGITFLGLLLIGPGRHRLTRSR